MWPTQTSYRNVAIAIEENVPKCSVLELQEFIYAASESRVYPSLKYISTVYKDKEEDDDGTTCVDCKRCFALNGHQWPYVKKMNELTLISKPILHPIVECSSSCQCTPSTW